MVMTFTTDSKKVSSALMHFHIGTTASEWAQDCQKPALNQTPVDFRTWATFKTAFEKHFVPVITTDLAQQHMFNMKQGPHQFNEWYQEWSTFATHSGANEDTQIYAFKHNLNNGIHQNLLGVSPTTTTLANLVIQSLWIRSHLWNLPKLEPPRTTPSSSCQELQPCYRWATNQWCCSPMS